MRVDNKRLWSRLADMAKHGATPAGGCNRQALTDEDAAGRRLFMSWCEAAGCELRIDTIGNIFARRNGDDNNLPPVITGSHLDTQPSGGKYDGVYGVLAGLEVIETLNDADVSTRHPVEVVVWTNEEGSRFDTAMMGSAVWAGTMPLEDAWALEDRAGHSVRRELERTGFLGTETAASFPVKAAFELHIEQGPVLESEGLDIGVVTGVQHMSRHRLVIRGAEAHAGPTPMSLRRDPIMALAKLLPAAYAMAEQHGPDGRITFGFLQAKPGSSNTVPGSLEITADIRHPVEASYQAMLEEFSDEVGKACAAHGLGHELDCFWESPGIDFDRECIEMVSAATTELGYSGRKMVSGAGHDACNVAAVAPTSMIFTPCEGGVSHNEAESITPEQAEAGANVLLHSVLPCAQGTA